MAAAAAAAAADINIMRSTARGLVSNRSIAPTWTARSSSICTPCVTSSVIHHTTAATHSSNHNRNQQQQQKRWSSHSPLGYPLSPPPKKITISTLQSLYTRAEPITMLTAHDFPSASVADAAGMEMILVGDSLAMVALGMHDTSEVTIEEMIVHCRSVSRATHTAFTVGDLPMGSYEVSPEQALASAIRIVKEGRMQGVKLEGGQEMADTIRKITTAGIPVVAHIGLTPQRQNALGGFKVQGKSKAAAFRLLEDALAVQGAGAFMVVLEAVPPEVADFVTKKLSIPTIGIGAGHGCSGQVLVQVDMSGYYPPGRFLPKFVKKYGDIWGEAFRSIRQYRDEVKNGSYPAKEHTYPMSKEGLAGFQAAIAECAEDDQNEEPQ